VARVLGIDIGGTKVALALGREDGRVEARFRRPLEPSGDGSRDLARIAADATALLASNAWSGVQAVSVERGRGRFWALQWHPEYDPHEVAALCRLRKAELIAQGTLADEGEAIAYMERLEALHESPADERLAASLGVTAGSTDAPAQLYLAPGATMEAPASSDAARARIATCDPTKDWESTIVCASETSGRTSVTLPGPRTTRPRPEISGGLSASVVPSAPTLLR